MKLYIIIAVKLLLTIIAVYYFSNQENQMNQHDSTTICINSDTVHRLCAQCYKRDEQSIKAKGYHVVGGGPTSVLKIGKSTDVLNCNDYLQLLDV